MTLPANIDFEVRTTGDDLNGGGFKYNGAGTDYAQQDAPVLTLTDLATSGVGSTTLTSVTGGFTAAMVDNLIQIASGTNLTPGFYHIKAYTDTNTVTLDRAPDDLVGGLSGGSGRVGGALASLGVFSEIAALELPRVWVKGGTYLLTTGTPGRGGPFQPPHTYGMYVEGYGSARGDLDRNNRPILKLNGQVPATTNKAMFSSTSTRNGQAGMLINFELDGDGDTSGCFGANAASRQRWHLLYVHGFGADGIRGGLDATGVLVEDCGGYGIYNPTNIHYCVARRCGFGFGGRALHCLAIDCTLDGFVSINSGIHHHCTSYNNGRHGFYNSPANATSSFYNCVAVNNAGYGYYTYNGATLTHVYGYGNVSGLASSPYGIGTRTDPQTSAWYGRFYDQVVPLTGDPFVDAAAGDFRPNSTHGAPLVLGGYYPPTPYTPDDDRPTIGYSVPEVLDPVTVNYGAEVEVTDLGDDLDAADLEATVDVVELE